MLFAPSTEIDMGADEDDFHTFKRRTVQVRKDEKLEQKVKRAVDLKAGAHSGLVKAFGKVPVASTKKIVYF
jgi:zinc finger CCHC domain-containing protein 9